MKDRGQAVKWLLLAVGLWAVETAALASRDANDQPLNVVLIVCDDLNDYVGPFGGHPQVITPHMDRLAASGVWFSQAHCTIHLFAILHGRVL